MAVPSKAKWGFASVAILAILGIAVGNLAVNYRAERILADSAKRAALQQAAAESAAEQEALRQQEIDNQIQAERTAELKARNDELERESRQLRSETKQIELETWGPDGPPKLLTRSQKKACAEWSEHNAMAGVDPRPVFCP